MAETTPPTLSPTPEPAAEPVPSSAPAPAAKPAAKASDENLIAALSYISLIAVVILLIKKESDYIQFHAKQGLVLFIAEVIWGVIATLLWFLPFISWLVWLVFFIVSVIGFIKAYNGERYRLPVVADIADKISI